MARLMSDAAVIERVFGHIDKGTTDLGDATWREPVANYRSPERFLAELALLRRLPIPFCPSAALPDRGSYVARSAAGTPLVVVRGEDNEVRGFRNACRHRGTPVAHGSGCAKAFVCGYHGWTYRLDGCLQHIPHEHGFPDLSKAMHSLVAVAVEEKGGLVFVTQEEPLSGEDTLGELPALISPEQQVLASAEKLGEVNWKLSMEGNLEGYHIKPTHRKSFYPYGFDNLTVVESFGNNTRVTFPFQRIEKLRSVPPEKRDISGMVTYAYSLFPNVLIAVLSSHTSMVIAEPVSPSQTRFITYQLGRAGPGVSAEDEEKSRRDADFVTQSGAKEDAAIVASIQSSLASGANDYFTYGKFEQGIVHFHRTLTGLLERLNGKDLEVEWAGGNDGPIDSKG